MKPSHIVTLDHLKGLAQSASPFDLEGTGTFMLRKVMRGYMVEANEYAKGKKKDSEPDMEKWSDFMVHKILAEPELLPEQVPLVLDVGQQKALLAEAFRRGGLSKEIVEEKKEDT